MAQADTTGAPAPRRTAIIAVHGVGSPLPDSTAQATADLLVRFQPSHYGTFAAQRLTIPTSPVPVRKADAPPPTPPPAPPPAGVAATAAPNRKSIGARMAVQLNAPIRKLGDDRSELRRVSEEPSSAGVAFMREQLGEYKSENRPYETLELIGERTNTDGSRVDVHVFEMHWADLSRLGNGFVQILGAIYQLVLHFCHLGRKAVDVGALYAPDPENQALNEAWRDWATCHVAAVRLFTIGVPLASLLMLACTLFFIPAGIASDKRFATGIVAAAVVLLLALGVACFRWIRTTKAAELYLASLAVVLTIATYVYVHPPMAEETLGTVLLTLIVALVGLGGYEAILRLYEKGRPGVFGLGNMAAAAVALLTLIPFHRSDELSAADVVRNAGFVAFQWSYLALVVVWSVLWFSAIVAVAASFRAWFLTKDTAARRRMRRTAWTARVTFAFSIVAFLVAMLVGYDAILELAQANVDKVNFFPQEPLHLVTTWAMPELHGTAYHFFEDLVMKSGTDALLYLFVGLGLSVVLIGWFILLIAVTAVRTPKPEWSLGEQLGRWFTAGFHWLRVSGNFATLSIFACIVIGGWMEYAPGTLRAILPAWFNDLLDESSTHRIVRALTYAVIASAASWAAFRFRVSEILSRARPALGIILDIDNYLRETPVDSTPRARIAERFASLLRHVTARTDEHGAPYFDRIVIVSHSQGTAISADFLRYLKEEDVADPAVTPSRFRLITMGSPLRQLYAANFPFLYAWVEETTTPVPPNTATPLAGRSPDPAALRVGKWVNLYTTGDYVGRTLWRWEDTDRVWQRESMDAAPDHDGRRERCLGAGTHTHYWDSKDVAEELDALVG